MTNTGNKELILLVGPQGSGKTTLAKKLMQGHAYVNQDLQGKDGHLKFFNQCLEEGVSIIVDRINHNKGQRARYLQPAKEKGYTTKIIVVHVPKQEAYNRACARKDHPNIKDAHTAAVALSFFFAQYERVEDNEADVVERLGWDKDYKAKAIIVDLDGTLCNIEHRLNTLKGPRKDWKRFFAGIPHDSVDNAVKAVLDGLRTTHSIILCSGRPDTHRPETEQWLKDQGIQYDRLFMRQRNDQRSDNIVKQIILDFDIKPDYDILFALDDRNSVCKMWRQNGIKCLQVAEGDF